MSTEAVKKTSISFKVDNWFTLYLKISTVEKAINGTRK